MLSPIAQSSRHTPLYEKIRSEFDKEEEKMTLEAKKKRLEELRSFNKPVRRADIAEHAMKYERTRLEKLER